MSSHEFHDKWHSTVTADEILKTAASLVCGERAKQHGDMHSCFDKVAQLWDAYLAIRSEARFTPHDVACMMELLKIARRHSGTSNPDDYIDAAGYAAIAGELKSKE